MTTTKIEYYLLKQKRNLVTDSAEFYNLSYEYLNDCLRAGLVYRREFYNDSELEPENSLMFKITLYSIWKYKFSFNRSMKKFVFLIFILSFQKRFDCSCRK